MVVVYGLPDYVASLNVRFNLILFIPWIILIINQIHKNSQNISENYTYFPNNAYSILMAPRRQKLWKLISALLWAITQRVFAAQIICEFQQPDSN